MRRYFFFVGENKNEKLFGKKKEPTPIELRMRMPVCAWWQKAIYKKNIYIFLRIDIPSVELQHKLNCAFNLVVFEVKEPLSPSNSCANIYYRSAEQFRFSSVYIFNGGSMYPCPFYRHSN